jgi:predicted metal-dependent phosphoesterase TrpH
MATADLHIHTTYSDGMATVPAVLQAASRTDLAVIAITDHDTIRGALEARDLAARYGIQVVPGIEITTREGHLLALYVDRLIPQGRPLLDTVLRVGELGGICVAPHPASRWVPSLSERAIRRTLAHPLAKRILVGLETYNGGLPRLPDTRHTEAIARATGLARLAGSDSHMLSTIGLYATEFPGTTAQELRAAIVDRQTQPCVGKRPAGFHLSFARAILLRRAGLAYWTAEPGERIVLRRLAEVSAPPPEVGALPPAR